MGTLPCDLRRIVNLNWGFVANDESLICKYAGTNYLKDGCLEIDNEVVSISIVNARLKNGNLQQKKDLIV